MCCGWREESLNAESRVVIEHVSPEIDCGRFAAKRVAGDRLTVKADIFTDGHDELAAVLLHRRLGEAAWHETAMEPLPNDRWRAAFTVEELGRYEYTVEAWVDPFKTWRRDLEKKVAADQEVSVELLVGSDLVNRTAERAVGEDARELGRREGLLRGGKPEDYVKRVALALDPELSNLMSKYPDRAAAARYTRTLVVEVDRERARYGAWYEMFPRSASSEPGRHATFADVAARLPYVASMGFDVLYLPPIHPIGSTFRKGKNNAPSSEPGDPGSPWAIGSEEGGHTEVDPRLGTLGDLRDLLARAQQFGIEIAIDLAFQVSPDHPYVRLHPEWFLHRPDGSIQYAENPPKKYQDIYPLNFETERWPELWSELKGVVLFWIEQGIRIFRVDNPHTKPFRFWEWLITEVKRDRPEVIFLSEAFTRPKVMYYLAKLGFSQSYTYFAWRNTKWELVKYFTELTQTEVGEYFRPSLWPNTPDILTEYLQFGGRPAFMARLVLAATLGANYGIYGPPFELQESTARAPGSEEYLNSERYEMRHWDLDAPHSLRHFIARVNWIRRENPALHSDRSLRFHETDNDQVIFYSKTTEDLSNLVLTAVNVDPHHTQSGWVNLDLDALGISPDQPFQVHDELTGARYLWQGRHNYLELNPHTVPAHILVVRRRQRSEKEFEYYA